MRGKDIKMKITKLQLKQIIKEELESVLNERRFKPLDRTALNSINLTLRKYGYCISGPESGACPADGEYNLIKL